MPADSVYVNVYYSLPIRKELPVSHLIIYVVVNYINDNICNTCRILAYNIIIYNYIIII